MSADSGDGSFFSWRRRRKERAEDAFPVSIYLGDGSRHAAVEAAVVSTLRRAGLAVTGGDEPVVGSWFRRLRASAQTAADSVPGRTAMHAVESALVTKLDAEITANLMRNLGPVIESVKDERDVVIRMGAALIVKSNGALVVLQLSADQQYHLNHRADLLMRPHAILRFLADVDPMPVRAALAADSAPGRSLLSPQPMAEADQPRPHTPPQPS